MCLAGCGSRPIWDCIMTRHQLRLPMPAGVSAQPSPIHPESPTTHDLPCEPPTLTDAERCVLNALLRAERPITRTELAGMRECSDFNFAQRRAAVAGLIQKRLAMTFRRPLGGSSRSSKWIAAMKYAPLPLGKSATDWAKSDDEERGWVK
jgi:hypothetical protein